LASAAESTVAPLSKSEQAQMQLVSSAVELKDAQAKLVPFTENLNAAIRDNLSITLSIKTKHQSHILGNPDSKIRMTIIIFEITGIPT
jgi:hypothetical protein